MTKNLSSISSTYSSPQLYESPFVIEENRVYYLWLGDGGGSVGSIVHIDGWLWAQQI